MDYAVQLNELPSLVREFASYKAVVQNASEKTISEYLLDLRTFFRFMLARDQRIDPLSEDFEKINISGVDLEYIKHITQEDIYEFLDEIIWRIENAKQSYQDLLKAEFKSSNTINFNGMCSRGGISSESWNLLDFWCAISGVDMTLFNDPAYMESAYYYFGNNYSAIDLSEVHLGSFVFTSETVGPGTGEVLYSITQEFPIYVDLSDFAPRSINSITLSETKIVF